MVKGQEYQDRLGQRILGFIQENQLLSGQHYLLVAVSGGPDSVCLLHILVKLREALGISLHIAHLNHQLRGAESEADANYVAGLAYRLDIPATIEQRDVKAYQAQQRLSLEEAAREVRYTFLAQLAESIGADRAAVGHTADDHIETILMHLIRGTGTRGLRGLQPSRRWQPSKNGLTIIRPLLPITRQETADYCRNHRLLPRIDTSNLSLSPLRNRIRHQVIPLLESYNPRVAEALARTARIAVDDLAFFNQEIDRLWDKIIQKQGSTITLDKKGVLELPSALKRYLLRRVIEDLSGNLKDIETRHIEEIIDALAKPTGKRLNLPGGLIFTIDYNQYLIGPKLAALSPFPILDAEFTLKFPGETALPGWRIEATIIRREQMTAQEEQFTAYFDPAKTGDKLLVRPRRPGDRFQPLGMSQPKKLGEYMIDAKIPAAWRQRIPLVCSPRYIIWVVGWRIDQRVKVSDTGKPVLCLKFERS